MHRLTSLKSLVVSLFVLIAPPALADQTVIPDYDSARDTYFYNKVYPNGGTTLYCGASFLTKKGLNVEHVYAASWMKETAGCPSTYSRQYCRDHFDRFNLMEADLHNLYPALAKVNRDRSNYMFAIIGDDDDAKIYSHDSVPEGCDFEIDADAETIEPAKDIRGEIARAVFYMNHEYGAPIDFEMGKLLYKWHRDDPPSADEVTRNDTIEGIQGTRNPFIDNPALAETFPFATAAAPVEEPSLQECLIKGNIGSSGSKIYHVPGARHYKNVKIDIEKGERWFCTVEEAIEAGWRAPR